MDDEHTMMISTAPAVDPAPGRAAEDRKGRWCPASHTTPELAADHHRVVGPLAPRSPPQQRLADRPRGAATTAHFSGMDHIRSKTRRWRRAWVRSSTTPSSTSGRANPDDRPHAAPGAASGARLSRRQAGARGRRAAGVLRCTQRLLRDAEQRRVAGRLRDPDREGAPRRAVADGGGGREIGASTHPYLQA